MTKDLEQSTRAQKLLGVIRQRINCGDGPILGYQTAGTLIGLDGDMGRPMGQVASRIDYACFVAGLPMLSHHWVRTIDGESNVQAFIEVWAPWKDEAVEMASNYKWTEDELDQVLGTLRGLPNVAVSSLWADAENRESEQPGYIRYNLHRRVAEQRRRNTLA